ncbi:MAG TPA: CDP-alcohol phosphatidyltransferase family protein [Candidatus Limnocylindria bacterium]|nr:CDP-alcohol phosphatidyltransferase family protein [Candidatus Limnocylindria bacterium]
MLANLISLSRLGLAVAFVYWAREPAVAIAILCVAGISDWLDGWVAKRLGHPTRLGTLLDPICDRLFVLPVLVTLVVVYGLTPARLAILVARDIVNSLGALVIWLVYPDRLQLLRPRRSGKIVTSLQFWTVVHMISGLPLFDLTFAAAAAANVWAVIDYSAQFRRVVGSAKSVSTP